MCDSVHRECAEWAKPWRQEADWWLRGAQGRGAGATVTGYEVSFRGGDSVLLLDYGG